MGSEMCIRDSTCSVKIEMSVIHIVHAGQKRARCGECSSCKRDDCGECVYCLDMKKFGGPGRKKCCVSRKCNSHQHSANSTVTADLEDQIQSTGADHPFDEPKFLLDQGRKAYRIKDDGNCMFRSIVYLATNNDENHASLRLLLQRFENLNKELFQGLLTKVNKPTVEEHIKHIGKPNTWGTHVELFATASYFQVPVYTYIVDDETKLRWEVFQPLTELSLIHI